MARRYTNLKAIFKARWFLAATVVYVLLLGHFLFSNFVITLGPSIVRGDDSSENVPVSAALFPPAVEGCPASPTFYHSTQRGFPYSGTPELPCGNGSGPNDLEASYNQRYLGIITASYLALLFIRLRQIPKA